MPQLSSTLTSTVCSRNTEKWSLCARFQRWWCHSWWVTRVAIPNEYMVNRALSRVNDISDFHSAAVVVLLFESAPGVIHTYNQAKSRETINNVKNSDRKGAREEWYPLQQHFKFLIHFFFFFELMSWVAKLIRCLRKCQFKITYLNDFQIYTGNSIV